MSSKVRLTFYMRNGHRMSTEITVEDAHRATEAVRLGWAKGPRESATLTVGDLSGRMPMWIRIEDISAMTTEPLEGQ